ncbi:Vasotab [Frankliniella fusca]|uniref:Vasotab n=1 Tax=Frankliniella fusca TaxID=407009 RepID=A0AAE1HR47_9NEOP|nr:Vasotab [Frankliniella fusca]
MNWTTLFIAVSTLLALVVLTKGHQRDDCPSFCPALVDPICAAESSNRKRERPFDNDCLRRQYNCDNNTDFKRLPYRCDVYIPANSQIITRRLTNKL